MEIGRLNRRCSPVQGIVEDSPQSDAGSSRTTTTWHWSLSSTAPSGKSSQSLRMRRSSTGSTTSTITSWGNDSLAYASRLRGEEARGIGERGHASSGIPWRRIPTYDSKGNLSKTGDATAAASPERSLRKRSQFSSRLSSSSSVRDLLDLDDDGQSSSVEACFHLPSMLRRPSLIALVLDDSIVSDAASPRHAEESPMKVRVSSGGPSATSRRLSPGSQKSFDFLPAERVEQNRRDAMIQGALASCRSSSSPRSLQSMMEMMEVLEKRLSKQTAQSVLAPIHSSQARDARDRRPRWA